MKWYKNLYLGRKAGLRKLKLHYDIRRGHFRPLTRVILLRESEGAPLEMYHSSALRLRPLCDEEYLIVGLAEGREEGIELLGRIIRDIYSYNGCSDIRDYFRR